MRIQGIMLLAGAIVVAGLGSFLHGCQDQVPKKPAIEKTDPKQGAVPGNNKSDVPESVLGTRGLKEKTSPERR